ncbi:hypothetical protein PG996_008046 [Apiospora saccharicola]|uniref:Uncharacterized protein n=1 Tax=Apiospora saccharicola TaxID=335842 RepID=A0ABR1UZY3_9PEZI
MEALGQGNGTAITIEQYWCVYPISGQYTRFQRILFYIAILFAFFTRFHHWLSSGALMFVVLYTITTAIHAIPLYLQPNVGCDSDSFAVPVVLYTAVGCSYVTVTFSPKIFNVSLRTFYRVWLVFLSVVSNISAYALGRMVNSSAQYTMDVKVTDEIDPPDPCSILNPNVLFRGGPNDGLNGVLIDRWTTQNATFFSNNTTMKLDPQGGYHVCLPRDNLLVVLLLVVPLTLIGLYNERRRPRESRRTAFRYMSSRRIPKSGTGPFRSFGIYLILGLEALYTFAIYLIPILCISYDILALLIGQRLEKMPWHHRHSEIQHLNSAGDIERAKYMAVLWYLTCLLAYLAWPVVLLYNIILNETLPLELPESEGPAAIGQWGPWVGFCLSGLLVILYELRKKQENREQRGDRLPLIAGDELDLAGNRDVNAQRWPYWRITKAVEIVVGEWRDLRTWWRDPIERDVVDDGTAVTPSRETRSLRSSSSGTVLARMRTW